ncbi:MFS transporter [Lactococcus nasutitermitis]|uniref:MFS transporter n=1 Tax=Lactococcus nasutitermitis TaxID=1652957 RepID=A0ABV9JAC6_9LACT|nr:MFS transporter [Lactococcus nasutitermitis]
MGNSKQIKALIAVGISILMSTLDGSIVNIALPTMARELHASTSQITWVVTVYLIVISAVILIFGRLSDLIGKTRIFKIGLIIFTIGSFLAGLNFGMGLAFLLVARVIQALGASMMMATSFGIVATIFPPETRARALSINSMFVSVGSIAGPALGGLILQVASWNYIFWLNVPVGIIAYLLGSRVLPTEKGQGNVRDVDLFGGAQMAAVITVLFLSLNFGSTLGWTSPWILGGAIIGILLLISFIRTENHKEKPMLDLNIFKTKLFSMSIITALLNFTAGMFVSILMPFYLQDFRVISPGLAGIIMMAYPAAMLITSPIAGVLSDKYDKELITFVGISGIIVAMICYLFIGDGTSILFVIIALAVHGGAAGVFQSPNNALVMSTVERKYLGIAGSVNSLGRNIAFALGTSLATISLFLAMSTIAGQHITTYVANRPQLFLDGLHIAFFVSLVLVIVTWILGLVRLIGNKK